MNQLHKLLEQYGLEYLYEPIKEALTKVFITNNFLIDKKTIETIAKKYNITEDIERILLNLDLIKEDSYNYTKDVVLYFLNKEKLNIVEELIIEEIEKKKDKIIKKIVNNYPLSFLKYLILVHDINGHIANREIFDNSTTLFTPASEFLRYIEDEIGIKYIQELKTSDEILEFIKNVVPKYIRKEVTGELFVKSFIKALIFHTKIGKEFFTSLIKDLKSLSLASITSLYDSKLNPSGLIYSTHVLVIQEILRLLDMKVKEDKLVREVWKKYHKFIFWLYVFAVMEELEVELRKNSLPRKEIIKILSNYGIPEDFFANVINNIFYKKARITSRYNYTDLDSPAFIILNPNKLKEVIISYCNKLAEKIFLRNYR